MFVDKEVEPSIRASAQGLFIIMTNGVGAIIGSFGSGWVVDRFTTIMEDGTRVTSWEPVWYIFAGYALTIAVLFALMFRYKEAKH